MSIKRFRIDNIESFKSKALKWAASFNTACLFDSNNYSDSYSEFDFMAAAGSVSSTKGNTFEKLQEFLSANPGWCMGFFSYDLKNDIEELDSTNKDYLDFPLLYFFSPLHHIILKGNEAEISSPEPDEVFRSINHLNERFGSVNFNGIIKSRFNRQEYIETIDQLKKHIARGDIYELNFCQEFFADQCQIDPVAAYHALNQLSPSPFSIFFKLDERYIISSTPERFLAKKGSKLISQPIKGTARRSIVQEEDASIIQNLRNNEKEQAENVMIVDLVRNDMTKSAVPGSVRVEELFGIYSFGQVHQMISTVVCEADPSKPLTELIKPLFPMGSMTGAPKLSAMHLIEQYERTKRGVFSGAAGYFSPGGDFDLNVVIRTLLYNAAENYLSFQAGSAITYESDPEKEYEECLLKAAAINKILAGTSG